MTKTPSNTPDYHHLTDMVTDAQNTEPDKNDSVNIHTKLQEKMKNQAVR